jgi:hypothetical protein
MRFNGIRVGRTFVTAMVIAVAGTVEASGQTNLSGVWSFRVTTETGVTYPEVLLEQDGDKLTGGYSSDALGQSPVSGRVTGWEMTFSFSVDLGGQLAQVVYTGTIEEDGGIIGTLDIGDGLLLGTFTATRSEG